jgi:Flp pilus assembly protein TadG
VGLHRARSKRASEPWRAESGQAIVLAAVWMAVLLGMAGFVIDVGSWYRQQRHLQSDADAAALAGAQELPTNVEAAGSFAQLYATKNGYTLPASDIKLSSDLAANDSITVNVDKAAPAFFSTIFGLASVNISANATARSDLLGQAKYVAPIVVNIKHPMLSGPSCPCFGEATTIPLGKSGAPGAFDLINLDGARGGDGGPSTLADWILNGYNGYLGLGGYYSNPGAKFNAAAIQSALTARIGTVLLFPVYDTLTGGGAGAQYNVIGWVGFHLDSFDARGSSGSISGHFTTITWAGIPADPGSSQPNLGARIVSLTH